MKIRMLISCGGAVGDFTAGTEYDVPTKVGKGLVSAKYAEAVKPSKAEKVAAEEAAAEAARVTAEAAPAAAEAAPVAAEKVNK